MKDRDLISLACAARENAYAPYSGFAVGAALLCTDGTVYSGCNIENASYPVTCCAERTALFAAAAAGKRSFSAIAVVGGKIGAEISCFCPPCGVCRQALAEFCTGDFRVLLWDGSTVRVMTLSDLLPESFGSGSMEDPG